MEKFDNFVKRYNDYYKERINGNKDKLIEAFVIYYGEEYRQVITERYNSIIFNWVVSSDFLKYHKDLFLYNRIDDMKKVLDSLGFNVKHITLNSKTCYKLSRPPVYHLKNVVNNYDDKFDRILTLLFGKNRIIDDNFPQTLFFKFDELEFNEKVKFAKKIYNKKQITNSDILKIEKTLIIAKNIYYKYINRKTDDYMTLIWYSLFYKKRLNKIVGTNLETDLQQNGLGFSKKDDSTAYTNFEVKEKVIINNIYLKIGLINDEILIHEINHNIVRSFLTFIDDAIIYKNGIQKAVNTKGSNIIKDKLLEEILTDKIAIEITDIFHKLNGRVFDDDFSFTSYYTKFFPLVDKFYEKLKEQLKEIRITDNHNLLYRYIDKEAYEQFCDYIQSISLETNKSVSQEQIYTSELFFKNHLFKNEHLDSIEEEMSQEEMIDYVKSLGYKVRPLNNIKK